MSLACSYTTNTTEDRFWSSGHDNSDFFSSAPLKNTAAATSDALYQRNVAQRVAACSVMTNCCQSCSSGMFQYHKDTSSTAEWSHPCIPLLVLGSEHCCMLYQGHVIHENRGNAFLWMQIHMWILGTIKGFLALPKPQFWLGRQCRKLALEDPDWRVV